MGSCGEVGWLWCRAVLAEKAGGGSFGWQGKKRKGDLFGLFGW
jgi:hypothetical protein